MFDRIDTQRAAIRMMMSEIEALSEIIADKNKAVWDVVRTRCPNVKAIESLGIPMQYNGLTKCITIGNYEFDAASLDALKKILPCKSLDRLSEIIKEE